MLMQSNLFSRPPLEDDDSPKMANAESAQANSHTIVKLHLKWI